MKVYKAIAVIFLAFSAVLSCSSFSVASQIHMAVINATNDKNLLQQSGIIADNFTGILAKSKAIIVVEREKLELVIREQGIKSSQLGDSGTAARIGKILGCEYILLSSLVYENAPVISARIVEAGTSRIVFSDTELSDVSDNSSINAASLRMAGKVLGIMTGEQAVITEIRGREIVINRGSASRTRNGDFFRVFIESKHKATELAVLRVKDARQNFSTAEIFKNGGDIKVLRRSDTVSAISKKEADSLIKRGKFAKKRPGEIDPTDSTMNRLKSSAGKEEKYFDTLKHSYDELAEKGRLALKRNDFKALGEIGGAFIKLGNEVKDYRMNNDVDERAHELNTMRADIPDSTSKNLLDRSNMLNEFSQQCFNAAVSFLRPLAERGDAEAQTNIGMLYVTYSIYPFGDSYSRDLQEALKFLNQAAAKGNIGAMYYLAVAYSQGVTIKPDYVKAVELFQRIIDKGISPAGTNRDFFRDACSELSTMYRMGMGVKQDDRKADELWFKMSGLSDEESEKRMRQVEQARERGGDVIISEGEGNLIVSDGGNVIVSGRGNLIKTDKDNTGNVTVSGIENAIITGEKDAAAKVMSTALAVSSQPGAIKIKLGVVRFESPANLAKEADSITDNIIKSLSASDALTVLNRRELNKSLTKNNDLEAISDLGRREGCKYMLIGSVNRDKEIIITVRAVDTETAKIIFSMSAASRSPKISSLLAGSAKLGEQVREKLTGEYPQISSVKGSEIYINRGSASGLRKGDLLRVYEELNEVIDRDGNSAGKNAIDLAIVEIKSAGKNSSTATIFKNGGDPRIIPRLPGKRIETISREEAKNLIRRKTFVLQTIEQKNSDMDELNRYLAMDFKHSADPVSRKELEAITRLAEAGNHYAQYELGNYYIAMKDFPTAIKWLEASNTSQAQRDLGCMYLYGLGVPQNYQKAFELITKAAGRHDPIAYIYLGFMYENGYGVKKDTQKADGMYKQFIEMSANNDELYRKVGVLNNFAYRKAIEHLQKDADKADFMTKINLAELYCVLIEFDVSGRVERNSESHKFMEKAHELYKKALAQCQQYQRDPNIGDDFSDVIEFITGQLKILSSIEIK